MKKARRWMIRGAAAISLVFCLWVGQTRDERKVLGVGRQHTAVEAEFYQDSCVFHLWRYTYPLVEMSPEAQVLRTDSCALVSYPAGNNVSASPVLSVPRWVFNDPVQVYDTEAFGFGVLRDDRMLALRPGVAIVDWSLKLPNWFVAVLAGVLPGILLVRFIRKQRAIELGYCGECGYDLRETPDRCPECGTISEKKINLVDPALMDQAEVVFWDRRWVLTSLAWVMLGLGVLYLAAWAFANMVRIGFTDDDRVIPPDWFFLVAMGIFPVVWFAKLWREMARTWGWSRASEKRGAGNRAS